MAAPARSAESKTHRKESRTKAAQGRGIAGKRAARTGGAGKQGKESKKPSRQEMARQVSQELAKLRPLLKDVGTALVDRLDGGLAGLAVWLEGKSLHGERLVLPRPPILSAMLADIRALKVKPKKGRVKDLARIEDLLESLDERMPPGP